MTTRNVHTPLRSGFRLWTPPFADGLPRNVVGMTQAARRAMTVADIASAQRGVVSRRQLRVLGISDATVRSHVDACRWVRLSARVIALQTGPLDDEQQAWFAVLDGGDDCAIGGLSALHRYGLTGFAVERLQTVVPIDARGRRTEAYVRRRSRRMGPSAVHPARQPPTLRLEPALLDALENIHLPLRGCALLAAVVQQRLLRADALRPLLLPQLTLPNRALYLAVSGDIEGGAHSLLEIDFGRIARRAGLPPPLRQTVRTDRWGRRRYLDIDLGAFGVEVDGAVHLRPLAWWDDMFRQNEIVIHDKPILRFASVGIRLQPELVADQLRAAGARWLRS